MEIDELTVSQAAVTVGRLMAATKALDEALRLVNMVRIGSGVPRYRNESHRVMDDIYDAKEILSDMQRLAEGVVGREKPGKLV
jgi:hypothetical protein